MSTARIRPVLRLVTKAKHLTAEIDRHIETHRQAALQWLRAVAADREAAELDVVNAGEWIVSIETRNRPSEGAVDWMRKQTRRGDLVHRSWAKSLLESLDGGMTNA